jgi:probable rRNA maturation factor
MPAFTLSIQGYGQFEALPARSTIRRWAAAALERDAELVVRLVGTREGRELNRAYRHKDYATNVLTFDYASTPVVRADIVLTVPVVRKEAREQGKFFAHHLAHLIVHAVLHAQGYRHERPRAALAMERQEVGVLAALKIPDPYEIRSGSDR